MTNLDKHVVQSIRQSPRTFERDGASCLISASSARAGLVSAVLEVVVDGEVVGYITSWSDSEHGAVKAGQFGNVMPQLFRSVEAALDEILR
jgi:hypothetical protein